MAHIYDCCESVVSPNRNLSQFSGELHSASLPPAVGVAAIRTLAQMHTQLESQHAMVCMHTQIARCRVVRLSAKQRNARSPPSVCVHSDSRQRQRMLKPTTLELNCARITQRRGDTANNTRCQQCKNVDATNYNKPETRCLFTYARHFSRCTRYVVRERETEPIFGPCVCIKAHYGYTVLWFRC